jgi:hypothetical protein
MRREMHLLSTHWSRVALAGAVGFLVMTGFLAAATPTAEAGPAGCSRQDYLDQSDILRPGRALCAGNYLLRMQKNGDLVLRHIPTGRACWHSRTFKPGVSATFTPGRGSGPAGQFAPFIQIGDRKIHGANNILDLGMNANLNSRGELWIGYAMVASCKKK